MMTIEQYLEPNPNLLPPWKCPRFWVPPAPSRASRQIALKSKGSVRGARVVNKITTVFESDLEDAVLLSVLGRADTADVWDQYPCVPYIDDEGKKRHFTFDYLVTHPDGSKTATSVKPAAKVESSGIERIHELLRAQMSPAVANRINLVTEDKLSLVDRFNAKLVYAVRRHPVPAHDAVIEELIRDLHGTTSIDALTKASGLKGYGYRAAVRLVADGRLRLTANCRIVRKALVYRPDKAV